MGVPVLTKKGFNFNSRCGESINHNIGLDEFIAENEEDYFDKALAIQKKKKLLKKAKRIHKNLTLIRVQS